MIRLLVTPSVPSIKRLSRLLAQAGLAGACFAVAMQATQDLLAQDAASSRRSARTVSTQLPMPAAELQAEEEEVVADEPARLPPVPGDQLAVEPTLPVPPVPPAPSASEPYEVYDENAWVEARDEYGRPIHLRERGLKYKLQDCYWGFPEYFCERPFGAGNRAAYDAVIGNGLGDYLILYQFDFQDAADGDSTQLNSAGIQRMQRMVRMLKGLNRHSIVVVESVPGNPRLSRARQQEVAGLLSRLGVNERVASVALGRPRPGMIGDEAVPNYRNFLNLGRTQGTSAMGIGGGAAGDTATGEGGAQATGGLQAR